MTKHDYCLADINSPKRLIPCSISVKNKYPTSHFPLPIFHQPRSAQVWTREAFTASRTPSCFKSQIQHTPHAVWTEGKARRDIHGISDWKEAYNETGGANSASTVYLCRSHHFASDHLFQCRAHVLLDSSSSLYCSKSIPV